jgi:hypothetical protein
MANQNLLTYGLKVTQLKQDYFGPELFLKNASYPNETVYCFLSRVDSWPVDTNTNLEIPANPTQDQKYIKNVFKNMFVAKQITSANMSPVTQRIDWTPGTIYDYYRDDIDMLATDVNGFLVKSFYIKNRYDQVFKCLWNGSNVNNPNGVPSTVEPFFQPGTYNTNNVYTGVDGYKWKYIYTIDIGSKVKFMDSSWIPVPVGTIVPNPQTTTAGIGGIDAINIINPGSGYDSVNSIVSIVITGDGTGASASPVYSGSTPNQTINDVTITNSGSNYTYAYVAIVSAASAAGAGPALGSGATAIAPVSPVGGHGFDPISELGCSHIMYAVEFNGTEGYQSNSVEYVPTNIDYRQVGLLFSPTASDTFPNPANNAIYDLTTQLTVASGFGNGFNSDETIVQYDPKSTSTVPIFTATVLSFNTSTNVLKVINTNGTPLTGATITGQTSKTSRTVLGISPSKFINFSGYIAYIENRTGVQRSRDGIEQFKFVLGY